MSYTKQLVPGLYLLTPGHQPPHSRPAPRGTPGRLGGRPKLFICQGAIFARRVSDVGSAALRIDRTVTAAGVKHEDTRTEAATMNQHPRIFFAKPQLLLARCLLLFARADPSAATWRRVSSSYSWSSINLNGRRGAETFPFHVKCDTTTRHSSRSPPVSSCLACRNIHTPPPPPPHQPTLASPIGFVRNGAATLG